MRLLVRKARPGQLCAADHSRPGSANYCMFCGRRYVTPLKHVYIQLKYSPLVKLAQMIPGNNIVTLAIVAAIFGGSYATVYNRPAPAPDLATVIIEMSDTCHRAPGSAICHNLIEQIQAGGKWEVLSADGIYWAEYLG